MNNNIDLSALDGLSEEEKKVALEILQQYAQEGESKILDNLTYADFSEIPVDITTFLHEPQYLGKALLDAEGKYTLYPYWEKTLQDIFPDNVTTKYNTVVFTGAIGLGKSTIAVIAILYMLYRLLCLKDPYLYYGMMPTDRLSISLMNITLDNARGVALEKMNSMLLTSDWFLRHGEMGGVTNLMYRPEKNIELVLASSNNQIIGRAIFCLDGKTKIKTDNGIFTLEELKDKQIRVISIDNNGNKVLSDYCTVKQTITTNEEYQITLEDGTVIKCTGNHRLLLKDGTYKEAMKLTELDELMDTQESYDEFIERIVTERGQWGLENNYEGHHIVPKCFGGTGSTKAKHENIIRLTPKEHYIAHKLLALEHPNCRSLVSAWEMMAYPKGKTKRDFFISADDYEVLRKLWSEHMSKDNPGIAKTGHPWNYGLGVKKEKSFIYINNGKINKQIKPDEEIPYGFVRGRITSVVEKTLLTKEQRHTIVSLATSGERNPMYGKGEKISGGKNGHAIKRYYFEDKIFECRKDLVEFLQTIDKSICISTIRKFESNSKRVLHEHQILNKLTWRFKDENKIN